MENLEMIRQWIEPVLKEENCELYDLEWDTAIRPAVLRIAVEKLDGPTDLDVCAACSDLISQVLDEKDFSESEYMLEVCSPGAEKELKTLEQRLRSAGEHVFLQLKNPQDGVDSVTGDVESVSPEAITIKYFIKGRPKKITVAMDNIKLLRLAVKF